MMGEDLGVEAKEASVREVAKLLPLPELLQSISSIKADYITRQQVSFRFRRRFLSQIWDSDVSYLNASPMVILFIEFWVLLRFLKKKILITFGLLIVWLLANGFLIFL